MEAKKNLSKFAFWVLPLTIPLFLVLCWFLFTKPTIQPPKIDDVASDFAVKTLAGSSFQLSSHRGRWVIIDFWSTWCGPCVEMLPVLQQFSQETKTKNVELIAIEIRADKEKAKELQGQLHLSFPIGLDETGIASDYQVSVVPAMFVIDPQGRIRLTLEGGHTISELRDIIKRLGV